MVEPRNNEVDLDARVERWRRRQERASSLSPRELDELEDHLRARVNLELELGSVLTPEQAFAIARREMGEPAALEKEFAKAGRPRWKALFAVGWAMFAASFGLPVTGLEILSDYGSYARATGFEVFIRSLGSLSLAVLPNVAMLLTIPAFRGRRLVGGRWLRRFLAFSGVAALGLGIVLSVDHALEILEIVGTSVRALFGVGYWAWAASFICVATALRLRGGGRAPAKPLAAGNSPTRGGVASTTG